MFTSLLAFMSSWVGIFVLLAIAAVVWIVMKATADLVTWFREEVLDNPYERKRSARPRRDSKVAERKNSTR